MRKTNNTRENRHTYVKKWVHIVFMTRYIEITILLLCLSTISIFTIPLSGKREQSADYIFW